MFSSGDKVRVKTTGEMGVLIELIEKDFAWIKVDNIEFVVNIEDIEHPYLQDFLEERKAAKLPKKMKDIILKDKKNSKELALPDGLYLVFFPVFHLEYMEELVARYKLYFYHEKQEKIDIEVIIFFKTNQIFNLKLTLEERAHFYFFDIPFEEASQNPVFKFKLVEKDKKGKSLIYEKELKLKNKQLFEKTEQLKLNNEAFFSFLLYQDKEEWLQKEKELFLPSSFLKTKKNRGLKKDFYDVMLGSKQEVDLHIEKLCKNPNDLLQGEMLQLQLKNLQKELDNALQSKQKTLIVIHGVGKGILKNEIHRILDQTFWVDKYVFEYTAKYGDGATKIYFK